MANQLSIPFKNTAHIPIKQAVRDYIQTHHPDTHPDAFKWDMNRWEQLRKEGVGGTVHVRKIDAALVYHAQLVFILTKLPPDVGLEISYTPVFGPSSTSVSLMNLAYERVAVLFNLASLFSQLAHSEDRSHPDGIKRALSYYQNAAGTLSYLMSSALPQLSRSLVDRSLPMEFTEPFLRCVEFLMLAQAQECAWQRAVMDHYKNGLIAKLSAKASSFYASSLNSIRDMPPATKQCFAPEWLVHIETKQYHFAAAAQYRKSIDDSEANKYGHELARLFEAQIMSKKGYDIARRGFAAKPVIEDVKSLLETVQKDVSRAERDNDLIYHQDVPAAPALPAIQEATMVQSTIPLGLQDPKKVIGDDGVIFGELVGYGARVAIEIYQERRRHWLENELYNRAQELDDTSAQTLQSLNLPASLEALDKPIGLPPSLLKKAEEVRLEDGPSRIETSISNVEMLAERNAAVLNEAMDMLDQEASEDEGIRHGFSKNTKAYPRPPSHEANQELTNKEKRYRQILEQAAESDEHVREKWSQWEETVVRLTWDEAVLERWVPSSTRSKFSNPETQAHARALRVNLESLDNLQRSRSLFIQRAQRLAEADDIQPRIMREASAIERWTEVEPVMFENTLDDELSKYEKFKDGIEESALKQEEILESIKTRNQQFLQSRRDDQSVKDREYALQSLDLAYHKYREINRNLNEGLKFYNDLANILMNFKEVCKDWVRARRDEISSLSESLSEVHIDENNAHSNPVSLPENNHAQDDDLATLPAPVLRQSLPNSQRSPPKSNRTALDLPAPDSDEWEAMPAMGTPPLFRGVPTAVNVTKTPRRSTRTKHSEGL